MSTPSPQFVKNFKKIQSMSVKNQTNQTNGLGYGTQPTRYVLSPAQQKFIHRLYHWLMNSNSQHLPSDPLQVMEYTSLVVRVISTNGYDEEDRFIINHIRYLYLKDKDTLPF
jgi:hypothetical protein